MGVETTVRQSYEDRAFVYWHGSIKKFFVSHGANDVGCVR